MHARIFTRRSFSLSFKWTLPSILQLICCLLLPPPFAATQHLSPFLPAGKSALDDCQCSCKMANFEIKLVLCRQVELIAVLLFPLLICCCVFCLNDELTATMDKEDYCMHVVLQMYQCLLLVKFCVAKRVVSSVQCKLYSNAISLNVSTPCIPSLIS